ncbi:MAG: right-handed parallel beta-helix repeat-containing protein, partial [Oscillospiraceae bacterium]|nr:right-handed parallel beta-helix repeat-containing protein [Oscillospiraceae bacterium]
SNATVIYVTNATKDTVTVTMPNKKGVDTELTGIQNIITNLKSNTTVGPDANRFIGNIEDPADMPNGDLYVDTVTCGLTIEGIGTDTTFNGFGLVIKNSSNIEARNLGFMNCNSSEGDDCGLQQKNDHIWVHHCDFFYGDAGSDADQVKGDGALDTKTSTYITHSYNHFWDNGKCNLQGMKSETTENYITYHHNWYDHSDSRHPRIRTCSVHIYNNYFDGNAKYGVGVTMGASAFVENNYFRNCKYPMLISMQGSDIAEGEGTFSSEDGGVIKAYGNYMTGQKAFVPYSENNTEFDAYVTSSRTATVPSSVTSKQGGTAYNNFDTNSSLMYSYTPDNAEDVPAKVTANAGRVQGGDFKWTFDNSVDDESYAVNEALKAALVAYKDSIVAIGSGFTDSTDPTATTAPQETTATSTETTKTTTATETTAEPAGTQAPANYAQIIYASPNGSGSGSSASDPTDVLTAIKNVPAGGCIYLLEGTYKYTDTILIDQNNSGSSGKYKTMSAYNGAKVVFDFTGQTVSSSARGFVLDGSYWHFYGFEIYNAGDNGLLLSGNNNIVEMMVFNDNEDTGLQISRYRTDAAAIADWPTNNLVKNCTSKNNCDEATMENADGFAAKLTCGEGNIFDGCISYNNSDDGWDLYAKEETGPIGVVTLKNCIAFRNGFTEDGRGYGDCDGNGFKLGGGGIGTRHKVENCLAFENLNCGFTDNNNPEFGDMKNCTAYNNNLKGAKANYMVYRCSTTATFANMMSYYNVANVSKTNATGIKAGNDKFVGAMTNGIYYNSNYYFAQSETLANGSKLGDIVTPADSDFVTLTVGAMGSTDFHTAWRNADGSPNPKGFAETLSNGTYASLGYHMMNGVTQTTTPSTSSGTTEPVSTTESKTTTETTASAVTPVASEYVHNFTVNGSASTFYTISGNMNSKDVAVSYAGLTLTKSLKMETATSITFTAPSAGTLTLVTDTASKSIKVNGTKYTTDANGVVTVDVAAGAVEITKGDAMNLVYIAYATSGTSTGSTGTSSQTTETTTTTTTETVEDYLRGDADGSGSVDILDVITINRAILGKEELSAVQVKAADVNNNGAPDSSDALMIMKKIVGLISAL